MWLCKGFVCVHNVCVMLLVCLCLRDVVCVRGIIYRGLISLCKCVQMYVSLWMYESICLCHRVQVKSVWSCTEVCWCDCVHMCDCFVFLQQKVCACVHVCVRARVRRSITDYEGGLSLKRSEALWTTIINSNLCLLCVCLSNESGWVTSWDDFSK